MFEFVRRNRVLVASLCCLALAAVLVASTATGRGRADRFGRLVMDLMAPLQKVGTGLTGGVAEAWRDAAAIFRRRAELDWLYDRIARANAPIPLKKSSGRTSAKRQLLSSEGWRGDAAGVVGGRDGLARTLTIDRGERDGVVKGAAVLAPGGVVGQVFLASAHAARVLLITDHNSGVDAIVQRTRARGIVEGTVTEGCGLKFVKRTEDLQPGDVVVTSGVDGIFPRGLPIGQLTSVDKRGQGLFQYASVRPFVDFDGWKRCWSRDGRGDRKTRSRSAGRRLTHADDAGGGGGGGGGDAAPDDARRVDDAAGRGRAEPRARPRRLPGAPPSRRRRRHRGVSARLLSRHVLRHITRCARGGLHGGVRGGVPDRADALDRGRPARDDRRLPRRARAHGRGVRRGGAGGSGVARLGGRRPPRARAGNLRGRRHAVDVRSQWSAGCCGSLDGDAPAASQHPFRAARVPPGWRHASRRWWGLLVASC
jgi:rod shape-determining protein MreC